MMPPETEVNPGATQLNPSCDSALPRTGDFAVIKAHGAAGQNPPFLEIRSYPTGAA